MRASLLTSVVVLMSASVADVRAEAEDPPPSFEVASIRVSGAVGGGNNIGVSQGTLTMRNVTLNICLKLAFGLQDSQIVGPDLLNSERYDIVAKASGPATGEEMKLMLQTLLADRFRLKFHRQTNEQNGFALVVAKGGPKFSPSVGEGLSTQRGKGTLVAQWTTMAQFADFLSGPTRMRVVDRTDLAGQFDFTFDLTADIPTDLQPGQEPDLVGIIMSNLQGQLGLKLESKKIPVEVLVVDQVEKPSVN